MRELDEELGIKTDVSENNFFSTVKYSYPDFAVTLYAVTLYCYLCYLSSDKFSLKEYVGFTWKETGDLKSLDWASADIQIIDDLIKHGIE